MPLQSHFNQWHSCIISRYIQQSVSFPIMLDFGRSRHIFTINSHNFLDSFLLGIFSRLSNQPCNYKLTAAWFSVFYIFF